MNKRTKKIINIFKQQKMVCLMLGGVLLNPIGCGSLSSSQVNNKSIIDELGMEKVSLEQCRRLEKSRNYSESMKKYVELLSQNQADRRLFEEGTLGKARSFYGMKKYTYALNALSPLPDKAESNFERRKLALAGQVMLSNSMHESAESVLELALSDLDEDEETDFAPSFANLGTIYLKNYKLQQGIIMYEKARNGFKATADFNKMNECNKILNNFRHFTSGKPNKN